MILIDEQFLPQILTMLRCATRQIDISTYKAEISHKPRGKLLLQFWELLREKRWQGVDIRFLINWNQERKSCPKTNINAYRFLHRAGIKVRSLTHNRCCHAKLIIVDRKCAVIGSHNLSIKSCHNNFELSTCIFDNTQTDLLQKYFDRVYADAIPFKE